MIANQLSFCSFYSLASNVELKAGYCCKTHQHSLRSFCFLESRKKFEARSVLMFAACPKLLHW